MRVGDLLIALFIFAGLVWPGYLYSLVARGNFSVYPIWEVVGDIFDGDDKPSLRTRVADSIRDNPNASIKNSLVGKGVSEEQANGLAANVDAARARGVSNSDIANAVRRANNNVDSINRAIESAGAAAQDGPSRLPTRAPTTTTGPTAVPPSGTPSTPTTGGGLVKVIPLGLNQWMSTQITIPQAAAASDELYLAHGDVKGTGSCNVMTWGPGQKVTGLSQATWQLMVIKGGSQADRDREAGNIQSIAARQTGSCPATQ